MKSCIQHLLIILALLALSSCSSIDSQNNIAYSHKPADTASEHSATSSENQVNTTRSNDSLYYLQIAEAQGLMFFISPIW